jgi:hypothetical protein
MDVLGIAKLATTVAETGNKQEVALTMLKKQQDMQESMAAQMLNAIAPPPPVQNLPANLGNTINTTA